MRRLAMRSALGKTRPDCPVETVLQLFSKTKRRKPLPHRVQKYRSDSFVPGLCVGLREIQTIIQDVECLDEQYSRVFPAYNRADVPVNGRFFGRPVVQLEIVVP